MRHLLASNAPGLAMSVYKYVFLDARWCQYVSRGRWAYAGPLSSYLVVRGNKSKSTRVYSTACARLVPQEMLCRDIERRRGWQRLAPIPPHCSPDCPECAVMLDAVEESR